MLSGAVLACLAEEGALPFPNALFDRILVIHALEEAESPLGLMREVWRVLRNDGVVFLNIADSYHGSGRGAGKI